ncbi:hypothetical protein BCT01_08545 [Vibrio tasmaniensis]|uniref:hypothetical protein n=1 Tax=Vibrio TaxID=662 RepID=UPI000C843972|nr:hypothetical protein [Vibrio tasmaniensis]PMO80330.1 hypothetical protein BCT01_08545 [Vibrio tasmaniensis]
MIFFDFFNKLRGNKKLQDECARYIDLEAPCLIDPATILTTQGVRLSLVRLNGSMNILGDAKSQEYALAYNNVLSILKSYFNSDKVCVAWMYEQDPNFSKDLINEVTRPSRIAGEKLGIDVEEMYQELNGANAEISMAQDNVIAIWTTPTTQMEYVDGKVVPVQTEEMQLSNMHKTLFQGASNPFLSDSQAVEIHSNNVKVILQQLRNADIICDKIESKEAAQWMLTRINPTHPKYTQLNFIDDKRIGTPTPGAWILNPDTNQLNIGAFLAEPLSAQMARKTIVEDGIDGVLKIGNRYFGTHTVDVPPKQNIPFNILLKRLKGVPCRITFIMKPKSKDMWSKLNESINRTIGGLTQKNREYYQKMILMDSFHQEFDAPPVNVQILITTWGESEQDINRHGESLQQAMTDWGGARVTFDNISPFQTYFSSIAGVNNASHSDGFLIGADKLADILPHQSESSINEYGPIVMRHESGKVCLLNPNNIYQDYDYTLYIARPRQGKSLTMNAKSIASMMPEGVTHMPLVVSMDIGPSSEGAFQYLRLMMEKKYGSDQTKRLIVCQRWDPSSDNWKVNPLDIRLGRKVPTNQEFQFIINFYASVCAEPETGFPCKGGKDILQGIIEATFLRLAQRNESKKFNAAISPELQSLTKKYGIVVSKTSSINSETILYKSYFEIRDELFQKGSIEGASLAHRMAMPTIDDLIQTLTTDAAIKKRYQRIYPEGIETIAFKLRAHITLMPHLTSNTTLDFADAHVISFDLKPIVSESTDNESRIRLFAEYLLAMNIGMKKFFINETILNGMDDLYHAYWKKGINQYRNVDKCLNLDEWHALTVKMNNDRGDSISVPVAGAMYIEWLVKEAPKWRLNINQASHSASDFTSTMKEKATNVFIYSGTTGKEVDTLKKDFSLSETQVKALTSLHGPNGKQGSQMLWLYTVNLPNMNSIRGSAKVEFLCKGSMLWGLNTSAKDLPHKLRLENEHAGKPWLKGLCKAFPSGSMENYRNGLVQSLRESNIAAEQMEKGIEEQIYDKSIVAMNTLQFGTEVIEDSELIKQKYS